MAISDLRQKLKPVPVANLEKDDQELNKTLGKSPNSDSDLIRFEEGTNLYRLYPPHEQLDEFGRVNSFAEPVVVVYVPAYVNEKDDKGNFKKDEKGEIKKTLSSRPVFNSVIHGKKGPTGQPLTKDLVEEYIKLAIQYSKEHFENNEDERKKYLEPIFGNFAKKINGITYSPKWTTYVEQIKGGEFHKFGRIEFGKSVKERINKISAVEAADDPLGTDPFTDLDEGRALKIIYDSKATKAEDYYQTEIDTTSVPETLPDGRKVSINKLYPIPDERLEVFAKAIPLAKIYRNAFTRKDFDTQLKGMEILDKKNNLKIFDSPEFQAIAEEIAKFYPPEESKAEEPEAAVKKEIPKTTPARETLLEKRVETPAEPEPITSSKETTEELPITSGEASPTDSFTYMTRKELIQYVSDAGIQIVVDDKLSDEEIRDELRIWRLENAEQFDRLLEGKTEPEPKVEEKPAPLTAKQRLEALRLKQS